MSSSGRLNPCSATQAVFPPSPQRVYSITMSPKVKILREKLAWESIGSNVVNAVRITLGISVEKFVLYGSSLA